ncbi:MAG: adenosine kinase [Candidatus Woesearchaeota archaeon]
MYEVAGISHPLIDICVEADENLISSANLKKGQFNLIKSEAFTEIISKIDKSKCKIVIGGSVSNTLAGLHLLGIKTAEYGKIGNDEYGEILKKNKKDKGIKCFFSEHELPTGTVLCLISPDAERTFAVCLGAATELSENDIITEDIAKAKIIHFTGYEFESPKVRLAIRKAVAIAKEKNILISFDLADPGVVQRNMIDLKAFVENNVNILFANEEEAEEFTGKPAEQAVEELGEIVDYAIVKIGNKGSYIKVAHSGNTFKIKAHKAKAKDTTGAGDMYAAGILYGILKQLPMEKTGKIASYTAAKVVENIGARLNSIDISHLLEE